MPILLLLGGGAGAYYVHQRYSTEIKKAAFAAASLYLITKV